MRSARSPRSSIPGFLRTPAGPGWALVGDAGCHKDPIQGLGVCEALRDAELLADAAGQGLSGRQPLDDALACYARRRDEALLPEHRESVEMARLAPVPSDVLRLRQALRDRPGDATRFFLATYERIPREDFFNPQNLERLLDSAPQQRAA